MWFKNLLVYRITKGVDAYEMGEFEEQLDARGLTNPSPISMKSTGWAGVAGERRILAVGGQILITLGAAERQLPPAVIKSELKTREKAVAADQGFPIGKRQRRELKQKVIDELMPKALIKVRTTQAWIDTLAGYLIVNTSSPARGEEVVNLLRETHPEFEVTQLDTKHGAPASAAQWMRSEGPGQFNLEDQVELAGSRQDQGDCQVRPTGYQLLRRSRSA
jgi:recombination associated protein RdgC